MCASLAPHVEAVAAHTEPYPDLAFKRGSLLGQLGIYLFASAQFRAALSILEAVLAIFEAAYGPDHAQVATTLTNLGNVQQQLDDQH